MSTSDQGVKTPQSPRSEIGDRSVGRAARTVDQVALEVAVGGAVARHGFVANSSFSSLTHCCPHSYRHAPGAGACHKVVGFLGRCSAQEEFMQQPSASCASTSYTVVHLRGVLVMQPVGH